MQTQATLTDGSELTHVKVRVDGSWVRIEHADAEREAGFDLTDFGKAENFRDLLAEFDLDPRAEYNEEYYGDDMPTPEHGKIDKSRNTDDRDYGNFVWANENVALIAGNNPLTGEYSDPDMRGVETGYASYIGLSGDPETVGEMYTAIKDRAAFIKGENPDEREFI